ncbi:MAG: carboxypeptidase regulatory-like domain-containing protein, partial [Gemmatimonadota bacterium]
ARAKRAMTNTSLALVFGALALPGFLSGQEIRARVVDDQSRQPIPGANATLSTNGAVITRARSDGSGFFKMKPPRAGDYEIAIEMIGYEPQRRSITFAAADLTIAAFVLKTQAVPVAPVEATARPQPAAGTAAGFSRSQHVIAGARLARFERMSATPLTVVRDLGLRVTENKLPTGATYLCVESVRNLPTISGMGGDSMDCQWPVIVIDGIMVADSKDAYRTFRQLQLRDMESFEFMTPVDAGHRYGMDASANGALVIWTRGMGPHKSKDRDNNKMQ